MSHAILSPSSASRWLKCPPSARLQLKFNDNVSPYAKEGTDCHLLCAYKLEKLLGDNPKDPREDLDYLNEDMEDWSDGYAAYVLEIMGNTNDPIVYVEEKMDLSMIIPEASGTADCLIVSEKELHIVDYKNGYLPVDAYENPQLLIYALGALYLFDDIYDIETVILHIYQPRRDNISVFTISKADLYKWSREVLEPGAKIAFEGKGDYEAGEHCRFCKAKNTCRKRAELALAIAREDFKRPPTLLDEEIEEALKNVDSLESWIKDIKDYALNKALQGKKWTGFKLVEGRSNRRYGDEEKVAEAVRAAGFNPYEEKLLGITAMTKLLGKEKFEELISDLLVKPKGKPMLVALSDKRKELETVKDEFQKL